MKDDFRRAAIRAFRTFMQGFLGVYMIGITGDNIGLPQFADVGLLDAAVAAGFVSMLSYVQNALEALTSQTYDRG